MSAKYSSVPVSPNLQPSKSDPIRPWFVAAEELDDFIGIRFGRIPPSETEPEWFYRSHADFDGIGGLADILRGRGARVEGLPTIPHPVEPSVKYLLRSVPDYFQPRERVSWKGRFPVAPSRPDRPPAAVAWKVFDEDFSTEIRRRCHAAGITVNSFLLRHICSALFPSMDDGDRTIPWMIPVNLRGKVRRDRDTENHSSFVRVVVDRADSEAEVHAKVYEALAAGGHWASWLAYSYGRPLPQAARRALISAERATGKWVVGAFSNLGVWDQDGSLGGEGIDGDWLFVPPAMSFFRIGAGCITFRRRLSLCIHLHPQLCEDPGFAWEWMDRWTAEIESAMCRDEAAGDAAAAS